MRKGSTPLADHFIYATAVMKISLCLKCGPQGTEYVAGYLIQCFSLYTVYFLVSL